MTFRHGEVSPTPQHKCQGPSKDAPRPPPMRWDTHSGAPSSPRSRSQQSGKITPADARGTHGREAQSQSQAGALELGP